jgi:hypothetical protein
MKLPSTGELWFLAQPAAGMSSTVSLSGGASTLRMPSAFA